MEKEYPITYAKCDYCTAKNHCATCSQELSQDLAGRPGIQSARVNTKTRLAQIEHDLGYDDLLDRLEGMGILIED